MQFGFLKEFFVSFVRTRAINRHFYRLVNLEAVRGTKSSKELPASLVQALVLSASSTPEELLENLGGITMG